MTLVIRGAHVWDGHADVRSREPWTLRIEGDRIAALGPDPGIALGLEGFDYTAGNEEGSREPNQTDVTALPGLIDAHVHLTLDPKITSPAKQLAVPHEQVWDGMCARAAAMVRAGITTARDLGGGRWSEIELRDQIARGERIGPRLLCAGQPLTTPGGHCHFWGGEARGAEQIRAGVDRQVEHRADWIKVMATGGVFTKGTSVTAVQYDEAELALIVGCARDRGRSVAAHCHGTQGIRNAAASGVKTIEHCSFAGGKGFGADFDETVVAQIAAAGAWVSPTVNAGWGRRIEKDGETTQFFQRMSQCLQALREGGVRLIASTDAGIPGVEHHRLAKGLEAFGRYAGLSPVEVLRTATSEPAVAFGLGDEIGSLVAGFAADLVLVRGNPLEDLTVLQQPLLVIARGRVVEVPAEVGD